VVRARRVEPDDGVVVDHAAGLVFGDLDEPDADLGAQGFLSDASEAGELAGQVDDEPAPQVRAAGVKQDVAGVVVAVRAQSLAEPWVIIGMGARAGDVAAMGAAALAGVTTGTAREFASVPVGVRGVDRAEAAGGKGGEHARVGGDGGGDAFAPGQPGADDLPGVVLVHLGTGRAGVLAAVPAGNAQHAAGFGVGVVDDAGLAGGPVDGVDAALEADGAGAVAGGSELGFPAVEVVAGS